MSSGSQKNANQLKAVAKGGVVVMLGRLLGKFLRFLLVLLIVRLISKADFGLISLAYVVLNVTATLATFGLVNGLPRFIAKQRAESGDQRSVIGMIIGSSAVFVMCTALISVIALYVFAESFSMLFNNPQLFNVFRAFAFLVLPLVGIKMISAIFRGLERALPRFIFEDVLIYVVRIGLMVPLFAFDQRFELVVWVYVLSSWVTFFFATGYTVRALRGYATLKPNLDTLVELLRFSFPLLGVSLLLQSSSWLGILLLGLWALAAEVASFTVALRMAEVLTIGIMALGFIFMPMAAKAVAREDREGLAHLYASTTKWASMFSLPLLLFFALDADYLIPAFFSDAYVESADMLKVLAAGYFVHIVLGLNGSTLLAFGESRRVFVGSALSGITTAVLAVMLTKTLGGLGVSIAVASGLTVCNLYLSNALYQQHGIKPLDRGNFRPIALFMSVGGVAGYLMVQAAGDVAIAHASILVVLYGVVFMALWSTRSLDETDIELLAALERRITGRTRLSARSGRL